MTGPPGDASAIVAFYRGGRDDRGRTLAEILNWDTDRLEHTHDFIQWLFPLRDRSMANPDAPVLSDGDVAEFRRDPALRQRMLDALAVMRAFYRFDAAAPRQWLHPGNHNYLRLTRMLRSLRTVGLEEAARSLFDDLAAVYRTHAAVIGARTYDYWRRAITDRLD